ncbi:L,D-transpeptidase family protein [Sphingomonas mesophila]|uniref:L,D-transpeptidase family protein n=1 Tax=Sphingomonas mesophila TaxID=2303576 RepID=UPI0013C2D06C|nr:L,D-transpeptidase family protein [Sphingomonas mesophila]
MRGSAILMSAVASLSLFSAPAEAKKRQSPPPPVPVRPAPILALPSSANAVTVNYFYERRQEAPIWFSGAGGAQAIADLLTILRRSAIDGLPQGPQYAAQVEAMVLAAQSGDAVARNTAERALSTAWVDYVQALQRPSTNVIWGDPYLVLKPSAPDRILTLLGAAPSIGQHVATVAAVNPYYAALRDVALTEQSAGGVSDAVKLNLERARILPGNGKYILVNSAEQRLHMMEGGRSVGSMKVVVGDPKPPMLLPTPIIASTMHYAIANPYWHVPPHLIRKFAPDIAKNPAAYMKSKDYEVLSDFSKNPQILSPTSVDWKAVAAGTEKVILRKRPGGTNSMGKMKFPFPNREGIFLHDSPERVHFGKENRNISNGCIRVEDYRRLAQWLFGRDVAATSNEPEQHLQLPKGVPVYSTYLTMIPGPAGMERFADRYGWDRPGAMAGGLPATAGGVQAGGSPN